MIRSVRDFLNMDNLVNVNMEIGPSEKLSEVISSALGAWIAPWAMKRVAKAEAEAERIKAIEGAKTEALLANNDERYAELSAMEKRIVAKESKRQNNINNVVAIAAQSLKDEKEVSSEPVNPDWATRFFDIAQDISDETMQDLWGRILAGEVTRPKSYSLRTLDVLKNITREEAELFEKAAQYVLYDGSYYLYHFSEGKEEYCPLEYADIARLIEIGLVQSGTDITQNYYHRDSDVPQHTLFYAEQYVAFFEIPSNLKQISFPIYQLTTVGSELYKLISIKPNMDFFEQMLQCIMKRNRFENNGINIRYAKLVRIDYENKQLEYDEDSVKEITLKSSVSE